MAVAHLVEAEIFTTTEVEEMHSAMARIAVLLMGARLVVENLDGILDTRLGKV